MWCSLGAWIQHYKASIDFLYLFLVFPPSLIPCLYCFCYCRHWVEAVMVLNLYLVIILFLSISHHWMLIINILLIFWLKIILKLLCYIQLPISCKIISRICCILSFMIDISLSFHYFLRGVAWWLEFNTTRQTLTFVPVSCVSTIINTMFVLFYLL